MGTNLTFAILATAAMASAHAGVLYKSIDSNGRTTFSDMPIDGAVVVRRIETSDSAKPAVGAENAPLYVALAQSGDEAVTRANAQVDMAEHALALARRSVFGDEDPLALSYTSPSRADAWRLESYKRDVREARKGLMRALQQRNLLAARPIA